MCVLTDVAILTDRNFMQKEAEKKLNAVVAQRLWNMKYVIVPVIIGATRIVTKGLKKHFEATPGKHSVDSLQKACILGMSHVTIAV